MTLSDLAKYLMTRGLSATAELLVLQSDSRLLNYGQKTMAAVLHLEFYLFFTIWSYGVHRVLNRVVHGSIFGDPTQPNASNVVYQISLKSDDFCDSTIFKMAAVCYLEVSKLEAYIT